jgi:HlyD family secretion protein
MKPVPMRWMWWVLGIAAVAGIGWSVMPAPASVEAARIARGPLIVTIDEDGRTRVRDRYTVSAPVSGYLTRIEYRPGAIVRAGQLVATILPAPPPPIDARSRSQLQARVEAAADALRQARVRVESARATLAQASRDLDRQRQLERERVVAPQELDLASTRQRVAETDVNGALAGVDVAEHDLEGARAALLAGDSGLVASRAAAIRAPQDGAILKVFEESERAVQAGTPLVEIGAASALEIVADLLSTDAVQVKPGSRVLIDRWGGEGVLNGRVRSVEPASFTKVSALGVEEQRVNVIIDFADAPELWQRLGDGFALEAHIVVWEEEHALKVPGGALFRRGDAWSVYKVTGSRAIEQRVSIGRRNDVEASVSEGLAEGDLVIVHPSDRIAGGMTVAIR